MPSPIPFDGAQARASNPNSHAVRVIRIFAICKRRHGELTAEGPAYTGAARTSAMGTLSLETRQGLSLAPRESWWSGSTGKKSNIHLEIAGARRPDGEAGRGWPCLCGGSVTVGPHRVRMFVILRLTRASERAFSILLPHPHTSPIHGGTESKPHGRPPACLRTRTRRVLYSPHIRIRMHTVVLVLRPSRAFGLVWFEKRKPPPIMIYVYMPDTPRLIRIYT